MQVFVLDLFSLGSDLSETCPTLKLKTLITD